MKDISYNHDVGFVLNCSYGNGWWLTPLQLCGLILRRGTGALEETEGGGKTKVTACVSLLNRSMLLVLAEEGTESPLAFHFLWILRRIL